MFERNNLNSNYLKSVTFSSFPVPISLSGDFSLISGVVDGGVENDAELLAEDDDEEVFFTAALGISSSGFDSFFFFFFFRSFSSDL